MKQFPPAPEYSIKTISNFENLRRYSQFKVPHRSQWHQWQICHRYTGCKIAADIVDTAGKFATSVNNTSGKFPQVSTTPAANLPPVSFTPMANNGSNYQTADNLKWTWKKKIYLYAYSTTQRCPKEIIKIFLIEDFFHLPPVSWHQWQTLSCEYLREFSKKNQNGPNGIIRGSGDWFMKKTRGKKSRDTVPLKGQPQ